MKKLRETLPLCVGQDESMDQDNACAMGLSLVYVPSGT